MNSFQDSHPLKKIMTAVEQLCTDSDFLLTRSDSPLMIKKNPSMSSFNQPKIIVEEMEIQHDVGPSRRGAESQAPLILNPKKSLENLLELINDPALLKSVAFNPNYYYETYKALTIYLEFFFTNPQENITVLEQSFGNASKRITNKGIKLTPERENEIFLKALLTTYFFHLVMEKVYVECLRINYESAVTRLDENAKVLVEMMQNHLNESFWTSIKNKERPKIFCQTGDAKNAKASPHPFRFLAEMDQKAMRINAKRLFLVRLRRFYLSFINSFSALMTIPFFAFLEAWLPQIIAYGNIIYFIPRIISDFLNLIYQVFILKPETIEISWTDLFQMHFSRRFDVFFRDLLWFTNGILGLFVLTGSLVGWGLWVNMIIQWTETILNLIILNSNKNHFNQIPEMLAHLGLPREHPRMVGIEKELNRRLDIDFQILYIRTCNSIVISLTSAMILPFFSHISVFIPLVGSFIALGLSYWQYYQAKEGLSKRAKIPDRMFSPKLTSDERFVSSLNLVSCS